MTAATFYTHLETPVGALLLAGSEGALTRIGFPSAAGPMRPEQCWIADDRPFETARRQLGAYFTGEAILFDLPLAPQGTPFQRAVWHALAAIPHGETRSYGDVARTLGRPGAARAVGAANARNPLPIVLPCHRVIGAGGSLTGFGGGLDVKRYLLGLEGVAPRQGVLL